MQWLDKRYEAFLNFQHKREVAQRAALGIYEELLQRIDVVSSNANQRGFNLARADESETSRKIIMFGSGTDRSSRGLEIGLADDRLSISASSDAGTATFTFHADDDDEVHLKVGNRQINTQDAAQHIMEPFLFEGKSPWKTS